MSKAVRWFSVLGAVAFLYWGVARLMDGSPIGWAFLLMSAAVWIYLIGSVRAERRAPRRDPQHPK
ncbi:hypothetical protein [Kocuria rosea]|uniref:hypothetical protein n=1 Tax=Kocuria rosea TaxID=1275 RepID=UPI00203E4D97|nr:hypothetical protein [Kocuria rosea]MCM3688302.1 hypothetical protein [Kocuria rosea]